MSAALLRSAAGRLRHAGRCCSLDAQPPALARDRSATASTSRRQELHSGRRTWGARRQRAALHAEAPPAEEVGDEWWEEARADAQPQAEVLTDVQLPPPTATRVKSAEYKCSSVRLDQCPPATLPEFAVIGRSNVGKSSLINMLTNNKSLAKVSKTPGKTQCINHFLVNSSWYLVDLPGYGYAKRSKTLRAEWSDFTQQYFLQRDTLANVLLLVDASVPVQALDLEVANWLGNAQVPFSLVFTKVDKRKKGVPPPSDNMTAFQERLLKEWAYLPGVVATSAVSTTGRVELLAYIAQLRELFVRAGKPSTARVSA